MNPAAVLDGKKVALYDLNNMTPSDSGLRSLYLLISFVTIICMRAKEVRGENSYNKQPCEAETV